MSDLEDRRRADLYEIDLRRKATLDPGNCWELIWFLGLSLEIRCSYMRILEACIDQAKTRQFLFRQSCYHQRNWREQEVPVMFLQTVQEGPSRSWGSIGKRQTRKSAETHLPAARRARAKGPTVMAKRSSPSQQPRPVSRPRSIPQTTTQQPNLPTPRPHKPGRSRSTQNHGTRPKSPSYFISKVVVVDAMAPVRPVTPHGLREAVRSIPTLQAQACGYDPATLNDGRISPPVLEPPPVQPIYGPGPLFPTEGNYRIEGKLVPHTLAFIVASGRTHTEPWRKRELPLADAGFDMHDFEKECPGVLMSLARVLFPKGAKDLTQAVPANRLIIDFVMGWSILPQARAMGQMPRPWQRCSCGEGIIQ